ncbi:creatininase [Sulfuriferula nivalis]|uniref:Creatinine amidohydrolase n=1 Tax=Sulfuriferula nivalis TaxID=2675298 RepID=A0A809RNZ8_9PROT|nr:creatininase [Sulfuriferula nivalis]BBP00541.1 creatinine amidohydrolase [Sulfuriferula nivalis]
MTETNFIHRKIGRITWTAYQKHLTREPIIFLPVGALEQHGPHLPMGCDAIFSEEVSLRVAEALNGLVLPPLTYGYKSQARSGGGQLFPGTTSLDGQTLTSMVQDILREVARHGVKRVAVINGHVENQWFLTEGIDLALREAKSNGNQMQIVRCEYWNFTPQDVLESLFEGAFPGVDLEHAALIETSMMLALYPSFVDLDNLPVDAYGQFPNYDSYPQNGHGVPASGVLAPASQSSAEKGNLLINSTVNAMVSALQNEFLIS